MQPDPGLSRFQERVAQTFFDLPEADGFLLAGGAGLIAHDMIHRPTHDLDLFTHRQHSVTQAHQAFRRAAAAQAWTVVGLHDSATFVRLEVADATGRTLIDLAVDSPALLPPTVTLLGPTLAPPELAARKLLALFDRAEARDFADVYELLHSFDRDQTLHLARQIDRGFDPRILAQMLRTHRRFADDRIPLSAESIPQARDFFDHWADGLADASA